MRSNTNRGLEMNKHRQVWKKLSSAVRGARREQEFCEHNKGIYYTAYRLAVSVALTELSRNTVFLMDQVANDNYDREPCDIIEMSHAYRVFDLGRAF